MMSDDLCQVVCLQGTGKANGLQTLALILNDLSFNMFEMTSVVRDMDIIVNPHLHSVVDAKLCIADEIIAILTIREHDDGGMISSVPYIETK